MRLSKRFVQNLEDMACDPSLSFDERHGAAELLVRLFTASQSPKGAVKDRGGSTPDLVSENAKRLLEQMK